MTAFLKCNKCGATGTTRAYYEPDVNYFGLDEDKEPEWREDGNDATCTHEDFEVINAEYDERLSDDVI